MLESPRSSARGDAFVLAPAASGIHHVTLELLGAEDVEEVAEIALRAASQLVVGGTVSLWVPVDDDQLECREALGEMGDRLRGVRIPVAAASTAIEGKSDQAVFASAISNEGEPVALLRISRSGDGGFSDAEQLLLRQITEAAGAAMFAAKRLAATRAETAERDRELDVVTAMSREIASTLDLDRVLRSAVNLASRVIAFDRCAIALYERGGCDIRAVAGADGVDPKNPALQDLAVRAAWAAGRGELLYISDRADPASDAERMFARVFRNDLERDGAASALYLPLKDEEGVIGILVFEAERVDFASEHQRTLAVILANQTTVALRNALLYRQVPMADALTALAARRQALLAIPVRRRVVYGVAAVAVLTALTLIRWPQRVVGIDPVLRSLATGVDRTDSLGVEFSVDQEDITRVHVGDAIRLRVRATPGQTFPGRVTSIAPAGIGDARSVRFPVHGVVANESAVLRPGMPAYARVLAEPSSALGRLVRGPARTLRLLWWRFWS